MRFRVAHPYLYARVSLMARRLLPEGSLESAANRPLAESRALFELAGAEPLMTYQSPTFHSLEQRRVSLLLEEVLILSRALSGNAREFLKYWTHLFELTNLKAIIRGRMAGRPPALIRRELLDMGPFAALPVDRLLSAENEAEMLRILEGTAFSDIASQARKVIAQQYDLFHLDTAFDRRFWSGLNERAMRVHAHDRASFAELLECLLDGTNLEWLLRYRFVYGLPPAETYYLLIPSPFRLRASRLKALTAASSLEGVLHALPQPLARRTAGSRSIDEVAGQLQRAAARVARAVLARSASAFVRSFAYLLLRDMDLRKLAVLVRSDQLGLSTDTRQIALRIAPAPGAAGA